MSVPGYVSDANLDDPCEHVAWAINSWPGVEKSQPYPAAPNPLLPYHSKYLFDLGFRYHPELATTKKVADKNGMPIVVSVDEPDPEVVEQELEGEGLPSDVLGLLAEVDPRMAEEIRNMSPSERASELKSRHSEFLESLEVLKQFGGEG